MVFRITRNFTAWLARHTTRRFLRTLTPTGSCVDIVVNNSDLEGEVKASDTPRDFSYRLHVIYERILPSRGRRVGECAMLQRPVASEINREHTLPATN